jgi:hypothetical protein
MRDAIEKLRFAVRELPPILTAISDGVASQPQGPGRWAKKEVIGHLIDSASNNHQRFVRGQLANRQEFPGYAQEDWVRVQQYRSVPWVELIELWRVYNAHLIRVAEAMSDEARLMTCRVAGETEAEVTLAALFEDYVAHLEHHLVAMLGRWPTGTP